jgi:hypothetical protein
MEVTPLGTTRPTVTPAPPTAAQPAPPAEPSAPAAPHVFGQPVASLQARDQAPAPQLLAQQVDRPTEVKLRVHPVTHSMVMSIVDESTGEVVGQLPPDQVLQIVADVLQLLREER